MVIMTAFVVEMNRFRVGINVIRLVIVIMLIGAVKWSRSVAVFVGVIVDGMVRAVIDTTWGVFFGIVLVVIVGPLVTLIR